VCPEIRLLGPTLLVDPRLLDLMFKRDMMFLSLVLQPDPLKLELNKFNVIINIKNTIICIINITIGIIINIINITLGSDVAARPKTLRSSVTERLTPRALGSVGAARFKSKAIGSGLEDRPRPKALEVFQPDPTLLGLAL